MTRPTPAALTRIATPFPPFSDAIPDALPLGQILRLSLFQVSVGMASVMRLAG